MRAVLGDQNGSVYLELAVCIVILFSVFAMLLTIPPIFLYKQNMDNACRQIATMAAETGSVGTTVTTYAKDVCREYKIVGDVSFSGQIEDEKIQLRNKFTTELTSTYRIRIGNFWGKEISIEVPLTSRVHSMGRRYLK